MAVELIFISADGSEEKKLVPKVKRLLDTLVYEYEEVPKFSIKTKGDCNVVIKHIVRPMVNLQGLFNVTDSTVVIDDLIGGYHVNIFNSKFTTSGAVLDNVNIYDSDLNIHSTNIYNSNITKSTLDCGEVTIDQSNINESKFEKVNMMLELGRVDNTNIRTIPKDLYVPKLELNMFGDVKDINFDWKGGKKFYHEYVACIGRNTKFVCKDNLFGIYRQEKTDEITGIEVDKPRSVLEYIYLNGTLSTLTEGRGVLNFNVEL